MNTSSTIIGVALATLITSSIAAQTTPQPLETIRNFQVVDATLSSAGQIGYDQIPLLSEQGYDVFVNLAIADERRNGEEGFLVAETGLTYVHIPVDWENPEVADVRMFFEEHGDVERIKAPLSFSGVAHDTIKNLSKISKHCRKQLACHQIEPTFLRIVY